MLRQKNSDGEPAKKKNFCVLCLKLAIFFMSAPPSTGVFAIFTMAIGALVTMALLPLSMCKCLHHCQTRIVALVACCQAGVVSLVVMALLPSMRRRLCHCRDCYCCPHDNCIVAIVDAQASLPLLSWRCCPRNNGIIALDLWWCCCSHCNGIIAVLKLVLLPLLQWHHYHL